MKNEIVVFCADNQRETIIARIQNVYKHRNRVEKLVENLNEKHLGICGFYIREITYI